MTIRLHANESPYDLMGDFKIKLNEAINTFAFNEYPDERYESLRETIGQYVSMDKSNIIVTNGSDELIKLLLETYTTEDSYVLAPTPSFVAYSFLSKVKGCNFCEVRPNVDLSFNKTEYLKQIKVLNPDLIFICTPNNPTGERLSESILEEIIMSTDKMVVVDEAYIEFSKGSIVKWTEKYSNLIVMRTLSKAFGLASLRVGYGISNEKVVSQLSDNKMPYNVSGLSAMTAELAIKNIDPVKIAKNIMDEKKIIEEELLTLPITLYPSESNFILVKTPYAKAIKEALAKENIKVRSFDQAPLLKNHFRFSVGQPKDNALVIKTIKEVLSI